MAVLPLHGASERGQASWTRQMACISRPRNLLISLGVLATLLFLFFTMSPREPGASGMPSFLDDIPFVGRPPAPPPAPPAPPPQMGGGYVDLDETPPVASYDDDKGTGVWAERAREVRNAFLHAYHSYEATAFGHDEIRPGSNKAVDNFNGWGVSIIDSLDTMVLMNLGPEIDRSLAFVASLNMTARAQPIHFFETVIRYLGGFLSAYNLMKEPMMLKKADDLARLLLPVFETKSGLPQYDAPSQPGVYAGSRSSMYLAEIGSCQMEFKYLAHLTGQDVYWKRADKITRLLDQHQASSGVPGLWGTNWNIDSGTPINGHYTIGALSDSAYEYLLKQYLLSGRTEKYLLDMYIKATDAMIEHTIYLSATRGLLYVTDVSGSGSNTMGSGKLEHLSCFLPGLFALGADQLSEHELDPARRRRHKWVAEGLAYTCYAMYAEQLHGLGPEDVTFHNGKRWGPILRDWEKTAKVDSEKPPGVGTLAPLVREGQGERDYPYYAGRYLLRPETIESVYLLWKTTHDAVWRERGYTMWAAVASQTRVERGFASVHSLNAGTVGHEDEMPSYFLAETLKYYYLLFSDADPWPLDRYVFNTEAHPLPVYHPRPWELTLFGISPAASA